VRELSPINKWPSESTECFLSESLSERERSPKRAKGTLFGAKEELLSCSTCTKEALADCLFWTSLLFSSALNSTDNWPANLDAES